MLTLIPLRWKILPKIFTANEFRIMDAPTANNDVVLASLGGRPRALEEKDEEQDKSASPASSQEDKWSAAERGEEGNAARRKVVAFDRD